MRVVTWIYCGLLILSSASECWGASASDRILFPHIPRAPGLASARGEGRVELPQVCVVIRTYWGHGGNNTSLQALIESLQRQRYTAWEALILVMDGKPFEDLPYILQRVNDDRVWMYADYVGQQFAPKVNGEFQIMYHEKLYNLTDDAIRACPRSSRWVVITNGDNLYANTFFERTYAGLRHNYFQAASHERSFRDASCYYDLYDNFGDRLLESGGVDIAAFDYYSRYQRSTGPPCTRFEAGKNLPQCKDNKLKWCQTDLGANVFNWPRLVAENRRFGTLAAESGGLTADNFDGVLVQKLVSQGWVSHHISDACLFDHSPSVQRCALDGGVWDDVANPSDSPGGNCITQEEATALLADHGETIEEMELRFSSDGNLEAFKVGDGPAPETIRCLRYRDIEGHQEAMMRFFGAHCTHDVDMPTVREFFRRKENAFYNYCTKEADCQ